VRRKSITKVVTLSVAHLIRVNHEVLS